MAAYDHVVRKLTATELKEKQQAQNYHLAEWPDSSYRAAECRRAKCRGIAVWRASYRYVTGRRGRTTSAETDLCESHAKAFITKNHLVAHHHNSDPHTTVFMSDEMGRRQAVGGWVCDQEAK